MEQLPDKIIGLDQVRINRGMGKRCKCKQRKLCLRLPKITLYINKKRILALFIY